MSGRPLFVRHSSVNEKETVTSMKLAIRCLFPAEALTAGKVDTLASPVAGGKVLGVKVLGVRDELN